MPEIQEKNKYLSNVNEHERDAHIRFEDEGHLYIVDGDASYKSVTTVVSDFHEHFNANEAIRKMRLSGKKFQPGEAYYNMTDAEIKKLWKENGIKASTAGTLMHFNIECFYNRNPFEHPDLPELNLFLKYEEEHVKPLGLVPFRTEWYIFDKEVRIAGSVDMIYRREGGPENEIYIYDWKRVNPLSKENSFSNMKEPFDRFPDCKYCHYSVQLNIYCYILEKCYGMKVMGMALVVLHELNDNWIVEPVGRLDEDIHLVMETRKKQVKGYTTFDGLKRVKI
jgi:hypothetical protein